MGNIYTHATARTSTTRIPIELSKEKYEELWQTIVTFEPTRRQTTPWANILLIGVHGSGKSSFINNVYSALRTDGLIAKQANVSKQGKSNTRKFTIYCPSIADSNLSFRICDTRGLKAGDEVVTIQQHDIEMILDGKIKDGYEFKMTPIKDGDPMLHKNPPPENKIHCIVYVVRYSKDIKIYESYEAQFKGIRDLVRDRDIPEVVLLTNIDKGEEDCPTSIKQLYEDEDVAEVTQQFEDFLRIPSSRVLPMKNYTSERRTNNENNILTLYNLYQMLEASNEFLNFKAKPMPKATPEDKEKHNQMSLDQLKRTLTEFRFTGGRNVNLFFFGALPSQVPEFLATTSSAFANTLIRKENFRLTEKEAKYNRMRKILLEDRQSALPMDCFYCGGLEDTHWLGIADFQLILQGRIKIGTKLSFASERDGNENAQGGAKSLKHAPPIDCVVFEVDARKSLEDVEKQFIEYLACLNETDVSRFVLVTNVHSIRSDITAENVYRCPEFRTYLDSLSEILHIQPSAMFPSIGYTNEQKVQNEMSCLALGSLLQLFQQAEYEIAVSSLD